MSMLKRKKAEPEVALCLRCGKPGTKQIWEHLVCEGCALDWYESPEVSELARVTLPMPLEESAEAWTRFTAEWVKRKRAA